MKPPRAKQGRVKAPPVVRKAKSAWRQTSGGQAHRDGHRSEWLAAAWLMLKGYQILAFRLKGHAGEIDILARRGRTLAVVEVKRRATLEAAQAAVTDIQYDRLLAAGRKVLHGRPSLAGHQLRIDMVALAKGRFPRHIRGIGRKRGGLP